MTRASPARVPAPTMRGALDTTPLAHVLVHALEKKLTGTLVLMGRAPTDAHGATSPLAVKARSAAVGLANGHVTKVKTSDVVVHLGRVLLELGYLTSEAHDASLRSLARAKGPHGKLLVESGSVTQAELRHGLKVQILQKLAHCFSFPETATFGYFANFDLLTDVPAGDAPPVDPLPAVWRGVCAYPSWSHITDTLARVGDTAVRLVGAADVARFAFDDEAAKAVALLRAQPMRVADFAASGLLSERAAKLLVYCLFLTRQLVPVDAPSAVGSSPSVAPAPAFASAPPAPRSPPPPAPPARVSLRPPVVIAAPPLEASDTFRRAEAALLDRDFREADALCRRGVEASPKDCRYPALLALLEARKPELAMAPPLAESVAALDAVIARDGTCERAFYYRALLHKQMKRDAFAARDFRRAAELDPDNSEAVREMLAHERRVRMP